MNTASVNLGGPDNDDQWVRQLESGEWVYTRIKLAPGRYKIRRMRILQCGMRVRVQIEDREIGRAA